VATEEQARRLVDALEMELIRRRPDIDRHNDYYQGKQPLQFASKEFRKYHGDRYARFSDNWVQVVGDSPVERLTVTGVQPAGEKEADEESWRVWQVNALDADSQLGFLGAVNSARSFVLVWGDPDDDDTPIVTFEDASQCIIAYQPGSRRRRKAALKRWQDGAVEFATLYLPREVWKFQRPVLGTREKSPQMEQVDEELRKWTPREFATEPNPQPNPMGVVPMVELPNKPLLVEDPISDVAGVVAMQDAINLLWAQTFTASDYASFPQRIVLGAERPVMPILNSAGEVVGEKVVDLEKFAVDRVLFVTGDGRPVEAVLMRYRAVRKRPARPGAHRPRSRRSLCLSNQSGCPLTCTFCATGTMRFGRNLTASEILDQVLHFRRIEPVDHLVFMGMGEPMMNLDHVLDAARVLHGHRGEHGKRMAAERGQREQIGLQSGSAGGV
jgi:hypothetical protein